MDKLLFLALLSSVSANQLWATKQAIPDVPVHQREDLEAHDIDTDIRAEMKREAEIVKKSRRSRTSIVEVSADANMDDDEDELVQEPVWTQEDRPIVRAKVNKLLSFMESHKQEYATGTTQQKEAILKRGEQMINSDMGVRGYDMKMCEKMWARQDEQATKYTTWYCPELVIPDEDPNAEPSWEETMNFKTSRVKAAYLTKLLFTSMLHNEEAGVNKMLGVSVCYWNGSLYCGFKEVSQILWSIGWPSSSKLSGPEDWSCSDLVCKAYITAWGDKRCSVFAGFDSTGYVSQVKVPLSSCWR